MPGLVEEAMAKKPISTRLERCLLLLAPPRVETCPRLLVRGHLLAFADGEDADDSDRSFVWFVAVDEPVARLAFAPGRVELDRAAIGEDLEAADDPHLASEVGVLLERDEQADDLSPQLGGEGMDVVAGFGEELDPLAQAAARRARSFARKSPRPSSAASSSRETRSPPVRASRSSSRTAMAKSSSCSSRSRTSEGSWVRASAVARRRLGCCRLVVLATATSVSGT